MITLLAYINSVVIAALLIAGGRVKICDYHRSKAATKAEAAEATAKAKDDEIEAQVYVQQ
ncbi:TPA: hypothetical protein ACOVJJ_004455 [Klebsiella oxytoca]